MSEAADTPQTVATNAPAHAPVKISAAARRLLVGDALSAFGGWIDFLAILTLAAWQFRVDPYQMALVGAAGLLPGMLAAPAIGRQCDRGNALRWLQGSLFVRAAATAGLLGCGSLAPFLVLVALRSLAASVAPPAINVLAARTLPALERPRFFALLNVLNSSAKVLAPALGTLSSSWSSEAVALAMSLACSMGALVALGGLRGSSPVAATASKESTGGASPHVAAQAEGATPPSASALVPLLWITATMAFAVFMTNNLVPLVLERAALDKVLLGVLVGCSGAGNVLAGLWLARRHAAIAPPRSEWTTLLAPALMQAAGFGAIAVGFWQWPAAAALWLPAVFFIIGSFSARFAIALNVHLSLRHAAQVGQVSGWMGSSQNAMMLVAPLAGAWVLERLGAPTLFASAALLAALSLALLMAFRGLRQNMPLGQAAP